MLDQGETVGHSGDEIADPAGTLALAFALVALDPFGRQIAGRALVAGKQVEHDLFGVPHHPHYPLGPVHPNLQERLDRGLLLRDRRRKGDQRRMVMADVLRELRSCRFQPPAGFRKHRADEMGDQFAHQFRAPPDVVEAGIVLVDTGDDFRGQRHHLELIDLEQAGTQTIVDVVGVVGDVVREGGDLCLQRGVAP